MTAPWKPPGPGALDDTEWPTHLIAKAFEPGADDDRLHGYAVLGDLARHYTHGELMYLAIVGEIPDRRAARLFDLALCSFAAVPICEAPSHVAVLSRICGGRLSSALGAGLVCLTDQAHALVERHARFLAWLDGDRAALPAQFRAADPGDPWVATLCDTFDAVAPPVPRVLRDLTRDAARLALLVEAGLREPQQLEAAIVTARVSGVAAEALPTGPADLRAYPVKLPPFHYVEDEPTSDNA